MVDRLVAALESDGVVVVPDLLDRAGFASMQRAFGLRLRQLRWNNRDGYEKTEPFRHMVEDVLTLDQGFLDAALHPVVKEVLRRYLGQFALVEARGWRSLPTRRDFHGWHGDAWYDQQVAKVIPREVKLGIYLTDVRSGAFNYVKGTHRKQHPRRIRTRDFPEALASQIVQVPGPAGTAFLFDTSGVHRQGVPLLEPREVVFFNYHDPSVPLQKGDIELYRYHPLLLNAAFLGDLSDEDRRILGFGDKTNYIPEFEGAPPREWLYQALAKAHHANLRLHDLRVRVVARLHRSVRGIAPR